MFPKSLASFIYCELLPQSFCSWDEGLVLIKPLHLWDTVSNRLLELGFRNFWKHSQWSRISQCSWGIVRCEAGRTRHIEGPSADKQREWKVPQNPDHQVFENLELEISSQGGCKRQTEESLSNAPPGPGKLCVYFPYCLKESWEDVSIFWFHLLKSNQTWSGYSSRKCLSTTEAQKS